MINNDTHRHIRMKTVDEVRIFSHSENMAASTPHPTNPYHRTSSIGLEAKSLGIPDPQRLSVQKGWRKPHLHSSVNGGLMEYRRP